MSSVLSTGELAQMQLDNIAHMMDTAVIVTRETAPASSWTPASNIPLEGALADTWYSFQDITKLWTDTGRTAQVTSDGDQVYGVTGVGSPAIHLAHITGTGDPTYQTGQQNSLSALYLANTDAGLRPDSTSDNQIVWAFAAKVAGSSGTIIGNSKVATTWGYLEKISGGFKYTSNTYTASVTHPEDEAWHIHTLQMPGAPGLLVWRIDGVQVKSETMTFATFSSPSMGQDRGTSASADGYIGEFISSRLALAAADIVSLETYLNNVWEVYPDFDAVGEQQVTWTDGATISCGLEFSPFKFRSRELLGEGLDVGEILVRCRVAMTHYATIQKEDRLRITKRHGVTLGTAETYTVQGFAERGPSALVLNLKRVEL